MIRKKNHNSTTVNTPEDFFSKKEYEEKEMFEKRKNELIKQFFIFWGSIIILFAIIAFHYRILGIFLFSVALFITYSVESQKRDKWKENFDIIMSNDIAKLFAYINYSIFLIFVILISYKFLKNNFNIDLVFMDKIIDWILFIISKH